MDDFFVISPSIMEYISMCDTEVWRDVPGYQGLYEASSLGNIRSNYCRTKNGKIILSNKINRKGYVTICLYKNKKRFSTEAHRIVANTFMPSSDNKLQINHINEIKNDNRICNLEWCTPKENLNHGSRNKRSAETLSKSIDQLSMSGELIKTWTSMQEAGRNGYRPAEICLCCKGKRHTHAGYRWSYSMN